MYICLTCDWPGCCVRITETYRASLRWSAYQIANLTESISTLWKKPNQLVCFLVSFALLVFNGDSLRQEWRHAYQVSEKIVACHTTLTKTFSVASHERSVVWNCRQLDCFLKGLFMTTTKKIPNSRLTGPLCERNPLVITVFSDKGSIMRKAFIRYGLMNYQMTHYSKTPYMLVVRVFMSSVHVSETIMYQCLAIAGWLRIIIS